MGKGECDFAIHVSVSRACCVFHGSGCWKGEDGAVCADVGVSRGSGFKKGGFRNAFSEVGPSAGGVKEEGVGVGGKENLDQRAGGGMR